MSTFPKLAEIKDIPIIGPSSALLLECFGIEDGDLPDTVPDDVDFSDLDVLARYFPAVYQKVADIAAGWGE